MEGTLPRRLHQLGRETRELELSARTRDYLASHNQQYERVE
jgi:hypothetical protein